MRNIMEDAKRIQDDLIRIRRELHMYPEISQGEQNTAEIIKRCLREEDISFDEHVGGFGIVATVRGAGPGKTVGLRADMDALQIQELNDVEYKSKNDNVMHACGHDAHMTFLLGAARLLNRYRGGFNGTVKLIFQPAEELSPVGGSRGILRSGKIDEVDAVFGMHVWPDLPVGKVGVREGAMMASSDHFYVEFQGKSSHAAKPHGGIDAVVVGAQFVTTLQTIISRETDPLDSAVLTIGKMIAGTRYNIIPEHCLLEGTCRTFREDTRNRIEARMQQLVEGISRATRATGKLTYERGYLSVQNDREMVGVVRRAVTRLFTEEALHPVEVPSMGGEDFSFYLQEKPGAFLWLGTGIENAENPPLHNSKFNIDEDILWRGAGLFSQIALEFLGE